MNAIANNIYYNPATHTTQYKTDYVQECLVERDNQEIMQKYLRGETLTESESKTVSDCATSNKIETAYIKKIIGDKSGFEPSWFKITGRDGNGCLWSVEIHADYLETVSEGYDEETVPIAEICGEEQE